MSNPAKLSELAEQIELARRSIDRWPGWLKDAAGVQSRDFAESKSDSQQQSEQTQTSRSGSGDLKP